MSMGWWNWDGWPKPEEWSAFWGFATFLVAAIAALLALRQLRAYINEQEERARPYVVVDFWFKANFSMYITIENISSTPATDITLLADPMVRSSKDSKRDVELAKIFGGDFVIPQLAPGATMRWYVDGAPHIFASNEVPHRWEITARYSDPRRLTGRARVPKQYPDKFVLDLDAFGQASGDEDYGSKMWNIASRNERRFESMKGALSSVAENLTELASLDPSRRRETIRARRRRTHRR